MINNNGTGYTVGDLVWDGGAVIADSWTVFKVTGIDASGGVTSLDCFSGGPYEIPRWAPGLQGNLGIISIEKENDLSALPVETFVDVIERIADARAENGAEQNRLNFIDNLLTEKQTNLEAAHGRIMDADVALESTRFARQNVLVQSSASMVAQANQITSIALSIIG